MKIGIFDSGIGGLAVLKEILNRGAASDIVYLADNKNFPFGEKTDREIHEIVGSGIRKLERLGCSAVILACNTASTVSLKQYKAEFPHLRILGIIPQLKEAVAKTKTKKIVVFATYATLASEEFKAMIDDVPKSFSIYTQASYEWVRLVESGDFSPKLVSDQARAYVENGVDTVVLGCTHFAFLEKVVKKSVGNDVCVLQSTGKMVEDIANLVSGQKTSSIEYFATKKDPRFNALVRKIMSNSSKVKLV